MGAGSLRKVKSQLGGCTGGCCSLGAGTLCLWCCGHSEHPAFPPKELSSELAVLHQGEATAAARDSAHPAPCHIALRTAGVKSTPEDTDTPLNTAPLQTSLPHLELPWAKPRPMLWEGFGSSC